MVIGELFFGATNSRNPSAEDGYALVCLAPEVANQSAALLFNGLAVENCAVSLSFGVRTTPALDAPDWQPAIISDSAGTGPL